MTSSTIVAPSRSGQERDAQPRRRVVRLSEAAIAPLMAAPAVVLLILFIVVPAVLMLGLAFTNARLISPRPAHFTGLTNLQALFADSTFWASLRNTAWFAVVVVPVQAGFALGLALLINAKVRGTTFFRTAYFVPVVTSMVVVSLLWRFIFQPDGLLNRLIASVTLGHVHGPDWLNDTRTALPAIMFMSIWQGVGFHMVIWLAGLQTIPPELYEAGSLDGATGWRRFRYITWPGLRQTRTFILITITIASFSLFTQVNIMTQGGPLDATTTLVFMELRSGYQQQQTGYASAIALVFFVLVLAVSTVQRFLTREKD